MAPALPLPTAMPPRTKPSIRASGRSAVRISTSSSHQRLGVPTCTIRSHAATPTIAAATATSPARRLTPRSSAVALHRPRRRRRTSSPPSAACGRAPLTSSSGRTSSAQPALHRRDRRGFLAHRHDGGAAVLSADFDGIAAEGLGVRRSVVENLTLKTLFYLGEASIQELGEHLRIAPYIVEGVFQRLRKDQLIQAVGLAQGGHRVTLTSAGR